MKLADYLGDLDPELAGKLESAISAVREDFDRKLADTVHATVAEVTEKPSTTIQNVYASLRKAADFLEDRPGKKEILLVTLENGDGEDDLERTVSHLVKKGVKVQAITREAYLSDTYWLRRPELWHPELFMNGAETAYQAALASAARVFDLSLMNFLY